MSAKVLRCAQITPCYCRYTKSYISSKISLDIYVCMYVRMYFNRISYIALKLFYYISVHFKVIYEVLFKYFSHVYAYKVGPYESLRSFGNSLLTELLHIRNHCGCSSSNFDKFYCFIKWWVLHSCLCLCPAVMKKPLCRE